MPVEALTETQKAYAAGIIDGEGCISINHRKGGIFVIKVHVTNTNILIINTFKDWFGGYVWSGKRAPWENAKTPHVWEVSCLKAKSCLLLVEPYLLLKRRQAELALNLQATFVRNGKNAVTPEVKDLRQIMISEISLLNKKGLSRAVA